MCFVSLATHLVIISADVNTVSHICRDDSEHLRSLSYALILDFTPQLFLS